MKQALLWIIGSAAFISLVVYAGLSQGEHCTTAEEATKEKLAELAYCSQDTDCTSVILSCPFDCNTPVHRSNVSEALAAVSSYQKDCMMVCPDCPKNSSGTTRCIEGVCVWRSLAR